MKTVNLFSRILITPIHRFCHTIKNEAYALEYKSTLSISCLTYYVKCMMYLEYTGNFRSFRFEYVLFDFFHLNGDDSVISDCLFVLLCNRNLESCSGMFSLSHIHIFCVSLRNHGACNVCGIDHRRTVAAHVRQYLKNKNLRSRLQLYWYLES